MSESGSRWEPGAPGAAEVPPSAGQPGAAPGPVVEEAGGARLPVVEEAGAALRLETTAPRPGRHSRTTLLLVAAGLVIFLAGGAGGYTFAVARSSAAHLVPSGFRLEGAVRGDDDGRRSFGQTDPFGNPFGNPFSSAPQGTTT